MPGIRIGLGVLSPFVGLGIASGLGGVPAGAVRLQGKAITLRGKAIIQTKAA